MAGNGLIVLDVCIKYFDVCKLFSDGLGRGINMEGREKTKWRIINSCWILMECAQVFIVLLEFFCVFEIFQNEKLCESWKFFPPEVGNKASMSFSTLLFSIMLEGLASTIGKKKKEKAYRVERKVEGELFPLELLGSGAMILIVFCNGELFSSQPISFSCLTHWWSIITFFLCQDVPPKSASCFLSSRNQRPRWALGKWENWSQSLKHAFGTCGYSSPTWVQIIMTHDFRVFCCSLSCLLTKKSLQKQLLHCCRDNQNQTIRWYNYPQEGFWCFLSFEQIEGREPKSPGALPPWSALPVSCLRSPPVLCSQQEGRVRGLFSILRLWWWRRSPSSISDSKRESQRK